jgi:hypothetical protein
VGLEDNEIVNERARYAALNGAVFIDPPVVCFAERVAGEVGRCRHW